jgi:uncharacterized protein YjiS (DUF1127 family)
MASFNFHASANDGAERSRPISFPADVANAALSIAPSPLSLISRLIDAFRTLQKRERDRVELGRMSHCELRDVRISPSERWAEISKPFWRV